MPAATRATAVEAGPPEPSLVAVPASTARKASLRARARAWRRIVGLIGSTLAIASVYSLGRLVCIGRIKTAQRWRARCVREWARRTSRRIGMTIETTGAPPLDGSLLVANHLSYVDVVALWSIHPAVFVAKSEVASWPLVGPIGKLIGTVFVDRQHHRDLPRVVAAMRDALAGGESVIFFPEGTSTPGSEVLPFKSSLFAPAVRANAPVACASLSYKIDDGGEPASEAICWWGDMDFAPHVYALLQRRRFTARVHFAAASLAGPDRKKISRDARAVVQDVFEQTVGEAL